MCAERKIFSAHPEQEVAAVAVRQHGVISRAQLLAAGLSDAGIRRRVEKGHLHRVHQGVFGVGHWPVTREARWMAGVLACGPGAALSHLDAASLWAIYRSSGPRIHVIAQTDRRVRGLRVHRVRRLHADDVTRRDGIPVTSLARTLIDLTDLLPEDRLLRGLREAEYLRLLDHAALGAAVERAHGRRRLDALKRAMSNHAPGQIVRDELEHRFLELVRQAAIRPPETNVRTNTKRRVYTVDCLWRAEGVAVELDGRAAHTRATAFEEDRERDAALSACGLRPVRFTWQRIENRGADVIADLLAMLAARG